MINNHYKYAFIDISYILNRNMFAISSGKSVGEYDSSDVVKSVLQSINKLKKDWNISAAKLILLKDRWMKDFPGYYTARVLDGGYKTERGNFTDDDENRIFIDKDILDKIKNDPKSTKKDIEKAEAKYYKNCQFMEAKYILTNELGIFGIPSITFEGWECDNLFWLASNVLISDNKNSVVITKDSDLKYSLSPNMDYFKIPRAGDKGLIITYDQMLNTIPSSLRDKVSLYNYHAIIDSFGGGHNDLTKLKVYGKNDDKVAAEILSGITKNITDVELFEKQFSTFNIENYPEYEEAKSFMTNRLSKFGRISQVNDFLLFCKKYNINFYSGNNYFYSQLTDSLDKLLY